MHTQVLTGAAAAAGFTRLLAATDDLVLDCPDAVHLLALFLGRAIVDEVLPPAFLTQVGGWVCVRRMSHTSRHAAVGVVVDSALTPAILLESERSCKCISVLIHNPLWSLWLEQFKPQSWCQTS
jgi:hypothetical protein